MANIFKAVPIFNKDDSHYVVEDGSRAIYIHNDETYEYDPTGVRGPELLNFKDGNEDTTRQAESDAAWVASCSPAKKLASKKASMIEANQMEAGKQIAALFQVEYGTEALRNKEANMQMLSAKLIRKEAKGIATAEDSEKLDEMELILEKIDQIRDLENSKAADINAISSQPELDDITAINWAQ